MLRTYWRCVRDLFRCHCVCVCTNNWCHDGTRRKPSSFFHEHCIIIMRVGFIRFFMILWIFVLCFITTIIHATITKWLLLFFIFLRSDVITLQEHELAWDGLFDLNSIDVQATHDSAHAIITAGLYYSVSSLPSRTATTPLASVPAGLRRLIINHCILSSLHGAVQFEHCNEIIRLSAFFWASSHKTPNYFATMSSLSTLIFLVQIATTAARSCPTPCGRYRRPSRQYRIS